MTKDRLAALVAVSENNVLSIREMNDKCGTHPVPKELPLHLCEQTQFKYPSN